MDHLLDIMAIEKKEQLFGEDCPAVAYREDLRKKVSVVADDVFHKTLSKAAKGCFRNSCKAPQLDGNT